jgi:RHS repeat-associated protein
VGTFTRNTSGQTVGIAWDRTGGGSITSDVVVRSRAGRVIDRSVDGVDPHPSGANYSYDTVGRLVAARAGTNFYQYGFAASGGCGAAPAAGKNANRTSITVNGTVAASFCYDSADRLTSVVSSTDPFDDYTGTISYDPRGNTTTLAGQELVYDAADRHLATHTPNSTSPTSSVVYERDVFDRIIGRAETVAGTTTVTRYGYTGTADTASLTMNAAGAVIETTQALPGGVLVTRTGTTQVWSYPDVHGSITATTDPAGVKQGLTRQYDPDGNPLTGLPDNATGRFDNAWLGQHQRRLDHTQGLRPVIQMGARPYDPLLARFLRVDPIEGGNTNDYDYCSGDPIGCTDLDGQIGFSIGGITVGDGCPLGKNPNGSCRGGDTARSVAKVTAVVGGIAGAAACGASIVCGIAVGAAAAGTLYLANHSGRQSFSMTGLGANMAIGGALGTLPGVARFARRGGEISIGANLRVAPFGNRTGHLTGRWPHYHRRVLDATGEIRPGGGLRRHRPWDRKSTDTSFWNRF